MVWPVFSYSLLTCSVIGKSHTPCYQSFTDKLYFNYHRLFQYYSYDNSLTLRWRPSQTGGTVSSSLFLDLKIAIKLIQSSGGTCTMKKKVIILGSKNQTFLWFSGMIYFYQQNYMLIIKWINSLNLTRGSESEHVPIPASCL